MKYFQIDGKIDEAMLNKFIDFCNQYETEECTIIVNSGGGKSTISTVMLHIINLNKQRFTLVSAGVYSAAFYIFYFAKCKRKIVIGSLGMIHKEYIDDVYINSNYKAIYPTDKCQIKNLKSIDDSWVYTFLTKKEAKQYKNSEDIYCTFERMTEIFPDVEVIHI